MAIQDARPSSFLQLTTQAEWENFLMACGIDSGVDGTTSLTPTLDTVGRNAVISAGRAVVKGQLWGCDASVSTAIPAASGLPRIDRLVLRYNRTASTQATVVSPIIVQGTPASSPTEPALVRTPSGNWDLPISSWTSQTNGTLSGLVDERQFTGRTVAEFNSAYRPNPSSPCLGHEIDTDKVYTWDGSSWTLVGPLQTDTWHTLSNPANWTGTTRVIKNYLSNSVRWHIQLTSNSIPGGTSYNLGTLPDASYYPTGVQRYPLGIDAQWLAGSGGTYAGLPRLYLPGAGNPQVIIPSLTASATLNIYGSFEVPLD